MYTRLLDSVQKKFELFSWNNFEGKNQSSIFIKICCVEYEICPAANSQMLLTAFTADET